MYDAFSVRGKKLEPERVCTMCTCGERSKHFIEDMMNLVLLFTYLNFQNSGLAKKSLLLVVRALVVKDQSILLRT